MEKWYVQGKSEKASRKFSVKKYWRKPNAGDMHDAICDFILGCGIPEPDKVDSPEVYTDDLIFVEGGAGEWNAGGRIHSDEAALAVRSWVGFCILDILSGYVIDRRGRKAAPAKELTVTVEKYDCSGGLSVRLASDDLHWDLSMMLLPCYCDNNRLGGWTTVSIAKRNRTEVR